MRSARYRRRMMPFAAAAVVAAATAVAPHAAMGQTWTTDASVGQASHRLPAGTFDTFGAQAGLHFDGVRWTYLSAGLPFDASGTPWGSGGAGGRLPLVAAGAGDDVRLGAGIDLAAHAFGYADRVRETTGGGVVAEALPVVFVSAGAVRLDARTGVVHYGRGGDTAFARTVHHSDARAAFAFGGVSVYGEARLVRAPEGPHPYVGGGVDAELGEVDVWARVGRWVDDADGTASWGGGLRVPVADGTSAFAAVGQDARDPLFREAPRRSWSVGVSRRLGRPPGPLPGLAPQAAGGSVTFRVSLAQAREAPALAGDFTGWEAVRMQRTAGGWELTMRVAPGVHRYAYRTADGSWFVPPGTPGRRDDGMGGVTAVLAVP
jgi:hypothetical protein